MRMRTFWMVPLLGACALLGSRNAWADAPFIDEFETHPMLRDPRIEVPPAVNVFDPALGGLWLGALKRPDVETRCQAANAIGEAVEMGMPHLEDAKAPLIDLLRAPSRDLRLAAAHALICFNDPSVGSSLLASVSAADVDTEMQLQVDPALARWGTAGAEDVFIKRIAWSDAQPQGIFSAVVSLGILKSTSAEKPLTAIVMDEKATDPLRLAAARSLTQIGGDGAVATAERLAIKDAPMIDRLLAATLLATATGKDAETALLGLAHDTEPAVVTTAAERLFEMDPRLLEPMTAILAASSDNTVRLTLVRALLAQHTLSAADSLLALLNDPSLQVRSTARAALTDLDADASLRPTLREAAKGMLAGVKPHEVAQSLNYLASVGDTSVADQAVANLSARSREVRIAAIVALRHFGLPGTLEAQRARTQQVLHSADRKGLSPKEIAEFDDELTFLIENVGLARDLESEAILRRVLPMKSGPLLQARIAAAWALGKMHEGQSSPGASSALLGRVNDHDSQHPESQEVQAMAVVGLGLMKSQAALPSLSSDVGVGRIIAAEHWAVAQITGKPLVPPPPLERTTRGWFLEPLN